MHSRSTSKYVGLFTTLWLSDYLVTLSPRILWWVQYCHNWKERQPKLIYLLLLMLLVMSAILSSFKLFFFNKKLFRWHCPLLVVITICTCHPFVSQSCLFSLCPLFKGHSFVFCVIFDCCVCTRVQFCCQLLIFSVVFYIWIM